MTQVQFRTKVSPDETGGRSKLHVDNSCKSSDMFFHFWILARQLTSNTSLHKTIHRIVLYKLVLIPYSFPWYTKDESCEEKVRPNVTRRINPTRTHSKSLRPPVSDWFGEDNIVVNRNAFRVSGIGKTAAVEPFPERKMPKWGQKGKCIAPCGGRDRLYVS